MSSALPAGGPSRISVNTTSASSRSTMRCAVVEPTNPPPTTVTFFRLILFSVYLYELCVSALSFSFLPPAPRGLFRDSHTLHIFDDRGRERRCADLGRTGHQSLEVVGDFLLLNRARDAVLD